VPTEIKLQPNAPVQLALQDPAGVPDGFKVIYALSDGRSLTLPRKTAIELNLLDLREGEAFMICRDVKENDRAVPESTYRVWLPAETEQARAAEEIAAAFQEPEPQSDPPQGETPGRLSGLKRKKPKFQDAPRLFDRGTGTYGPIPATVPIPEPLTAQIRASGPVPMNIAFSECIAFVTKALKDAGEQWTDQAKEAAVCTCIISAAKRGWISRWER
jgi:hypothetical protein